jgi:crotonobetainyl-CoA:carnitine CoA-transferase CaiB-like acyl-CoA transferase
VFDLTLWMVGPWASMQLGALGADVIHIEQPDVDPRTLGAGVPPTINGTSCGYIAWNMNKRGLFLDLKAEHDRETAYNVLRTSDVFLINMRPGAAERMGMGYERVAAINPNIIYCAITGWGEHGPMRDRPGADPQVQYFSGFWSLNGQRGERAEVYRHFTQMDATTGNYAAQAVIMALLARKRTGRGQRIDLSMLRATAALQTVGLSAHLAAGEVASPLGSAAFATAPDRAFRCLDGEWIGVSVTSAPQWAAFCTAIECPELRDDPRFATNQPRVHHRAELAALLEPRFASLPRHHWILRLDDAGVPCGYPLTFDQLRHHAAVIENGYLPEVQTSGWGSVFTGGPPWQFERTPASWSGTPLPGEHTADILDEIAAAKLAAGGDGR